MSDSSDENKNPDVRKSGKSRKTDHTTFRGKSEVEDDRMSVHVNDTPDNISELIQDDAEESDTGSPDETLNSLGEKFEEIEPTRADVRQKFAEIVEKRWNKKLSFARLTSLQDTYTRPANCPTVCSMSVNPEIWAKLPYYQQQSDKNVSNIQEAVQKAALISIQTAHTLSSVKAKELDAKALLTQQVDSIALLGQYQPRISMSTPL